MAVISDGTHKTPNYTSSGVPFLSVQNISSGRLDMGKAKYISRAEHIQLCQRIAPSKGDILICRIGTLGKAIKVYWDFEFSVFVSLGVLRPVSDDITDFVISYINSPIGFNWIQSVKVGGGTHTYKINLSDIPQMLICLPPLKEQQRISESLKSVDSVVAHYGQLQERLDVLKAELNDKLKKSILQEAIQGKLVEQDSDDEPASVLLDQIRKEKEFLLKEGKLKKKDVLDSSIFKGDDNKYFEKIGDNLLDINDSIPFDIPNSWTWVRLQEACVYIHRGKSPKYSEIKQYPVIAQKCNQWDGFHLEKAQFITPDSVSSYSKESVLQDKDLLWNSTGLGTLGRIGIYPAASNPYGFAVADSHVTVIRTISNLLRPEFLLLYLSSPTVQNGIEDKASGSTKQKELATDTIKSYYVPIPPITEQDRILEKYKSVIASIMRK